LYSHSGPAQMAAQLARKPRKQATQERSRATVAALIEATARILVSDGFDKTSTNRIAEVAGVSVGSLYQYFPSKEALVAAVAERHNREIMEVIGVTLEEIDSLPVEQAIRSLVGVAIQAHRVDPGLHRVLAEQIPRIGPLEQLEMANRQAYARFSAYLESRRDELGLVNVGLAAFVCATSIEALAHNAVLHQGDMFSGSAAEGLIDHATHLIVGYLRRADPSSSRQ
jgi:AcrR family transcriptional regulator